MVRSVFTSWGSALGGLRAVVVLAEELISRTVPLVGKIVHSLSADLPWQREGRGGSVFVLGERHRSEVVRRQIRNSFDGRCASSERQELRGVSFIEWTVVPTQGGAGTCRRLISQGGG